MALLSKDEMIAALQRLGELAQSQNIEIELLTVGGAVMALAYKVRLATHDADAIGLVCALVQDFLRQHPKLTEVPRPQTTDERIMALAAGLLELFATRLQQIPPVWTTQVGAVKEPIFLIKAAYQMRRLRELYLAESPELLRKRQFYEVPDYLTSV